MSNFAIFTGKIKKNTLFIDQSAFSNFALYVISYGNGASHRLDKQSLQDEPSSLQVHQENKINKINKVKCMYNWE